MDTLLTTEEIRSRLIKLGINIKRPTPDKWYLNGTNMSRVDLSRRRGQLHELASLVKDTYIPFTTIAREGTKITSMQREFRHYYWYKDKYFSYSSDKIVTQIPQLFEKKIIPWANKINSKLRDERK